MPRSRINSRSNDLLKDDGAILLSIVKGEQVQFEVTLGWLTNLTGYTITPKIVEANVVGLDTDSTTDDLPTSKQTGGQVKTLTVIDSTVTDNKFKLVIPEDLVDLYVTQPTPEHPVYGFFGLEIRDNGVGNQQQVWKPMRGLVEILYSPSEET